MLISLNGDGPINLRLYRGLRHAILEGRLTAGAQLPSTRSLAIDLGVSRKVVAAAFMRLSDEGYVEARVGAGTFVSTTLPDAALAPWRGKPRDARRRTEAPIRLSSHARRMLAVAPWPPPPVRSPQALRYDFHYGSPAVADFPQSTWSRLVAKRARRLSFRMLSYGRTLGFPPLREAIADYIARARGVAAAAGQVVVVTGSQQALDLIVRMLVDPGDRVVVEDPGYQGARQVLLAAGARVLPTPVDDAGLDVSRLPRREVRLAYVTPSHQFPLGGVLPLARRLELLRWADATQAIVVEDDYDSEFRYDGHPVEALQGLDRNGRVLYVGTFSKILFPSLRLAYLVVPESLIPAVKRVKFLTDYHTPTFEQSVLADFIAEGHFERHLRRARRRNAARRRALLDALEDRFGDRVEVVGANAGLHVVVWLRDVDVAALEDVTRRAAARGVGIYPITPYYMRPPNRAGLLFGYAPLTEREIREGVAALRDSL